MIGISNKCQDTSCYLDIDKDFDSIDSSDEDYDNYIRFHICDNMNNHIDGYYLFDIFMGGLKLIEDIDDDLSPSIERDIYNGDKLIITGVDEV